MKLVDFSYTDLKGKETTRKVLVTHMPTNKVMGVDVSEIDYEQAVYFGQSYQLLLDDFTKKVAELEAHYDVRHRVRQFFPDKMVVHTEEDL